MPIGRPANWSTGSTPGETVDYVGGYADTVARGRQGPHRNRLLITSGNDATDVVDTDGPTADRNYFVKVFVPVTVTLAELCVRVEQAGTGTVALAGCTLALFDRAGVRRGISADQATAWGTQGDKFAALTADTNQTLTITGGPSEFCLLSVRVGTQSTTPVKIGRTNWVGQSNIGLAAADVYRAGFVSGAVPTSIDPALLTNDPYRHFWIGGR